MFEDDPAPDFNEDQHWVDDEAVAAIERLAEVFWNAGCNVNGIVIKVPSLPGLNQDIQTDYGIVKVEAAEI